MVRDGTFTKEPSPSVQSVSVDETTEVWNTADAKSRDLHVAESLALPSSAACNTAAELPSTGYTEVEVNSPKSLNLPDVSDENNTSVTAEIHVPPDYIASLLLGDKGLGTSKLKSSGASRSVGNLMAINSQSRPTSPRSGPATPTVGRKSIDSQLTDIAAAAASKKSTRNKISSLWHRDRPSKSEATKNLAPVDGEQSSGVVDAKCRDGLGKSPRSFRKSFPLRKSKKTAEKDERPVAETRLMRSETFEMVDNDDKTAERSARGADEVLTSATDGEPELTSPVSTDLSEVRRSSVDNMNETPPNYAGGSKGFKGLGFLKRFSKDKPKEDKSLVECEVSQTKKKGFSLWRRDHSAVGSKKWKKKRSDGECDGVVKSATLPSDAAFKASRSSEESLSVLRVSSSATTEALISAASSSLVSDCSSSPRDADAVERSSAAGALGASVNQSTDIVSDTGSESPQRRRNCTSIVTTV